MRRIFALLLTLFVISCNTDTNSFKLEGMATGFADDTPVYVFAVADNNQSKTIDTLQIKNEKFVGIFLKTEEAVVHYLRIDKLNSNILYFPENVDLTATIYKDSIQSSYIGGSPQNDAYNEFTKNLRSYNVQKGENMKRFNQARREQDNLLVSEIQKENAVLVNEEANYKKQFVNSNNNSLISVMLLSEMVSRKEVSATEATAIIENLSPKVAATNSTQLLKTMIANMQKAELGGTAPNFSAPDPNGEMLALYDILGKYTIIDFWASWCRPCRRENPNVVKVYNKYHDKGLNIISVSLDKQGQKERWLKAIKDDKMNWYHVSNLQFWNDPIAKQYSVRSIPATFLLDENGKIIGKNLRGPALETRIAELLGE